MIKGIIEMNVKSIVRPALLLAVTMGVILSGCSKSSTSDAQTTQPSSNFNQSGYPIVKDKLTLKFVISKANQQKKNMDQLKVVQDMEALTNIHIGWDASEQGYEEKKNLMFASGDLPDAFFGGGSLTDADILKYGTQGLLIPLEKLIDQYSPNIKKLLEENPDIKKVVTAPDGHIYSIPNVITEGANDLGEVYFINKTWLDKLGLSVPTTTVEFEQVLKAFKDKDLNGNGKIDEIPFSFSNGNTLNGIFGLYGSFGLPDNTSHVIVQDNKVSYTATTPEFKEATKYLNTL